MEGRWSWRRLRPCVGRGSRQRWPCLLGKEWEEREGKVFVSWDCVLLLAPGTFLSTESWEGWRSRKGVWGTLGEVGVQPQGQTDANKPRARTPSPGTLGDKQAWPVAGLAWPRWR